MMLTTNGAVIRVIEAFEGKPMFTLSGYQNNKGLPIEASFTPDSQFVISGSTDGRLHMWRTDSGQRCGVLTGEHGNPVTNVQFNPRYVIEINKLDFPLNTTFQVLFDSFCVPVTLHVGAWL